jgi:hypothetical protein
VDPTVVRALQRAIAAFVVTFVVGSGVVLAIDTAGDDGVVADDPGTSVGPSGDNGSTAAPATTPEAYLVWMPSGIPDASAAELTTLPRVRRAALATASVAWLTRSIDEDGEVVDAPDAPFAIPLEVTGIDPAAFSSFLPAGEDRDLIRSLAADQVILSSSSAKRRGLGVGSTMEFEPGVELGVVGVVPDVLVGGYEAVVVRRTAETMGADLARYALLRTNKGQTPSRERITNDVTELVEAEVRAPAIEVRMPGDTPLLRAHDRSPTPSTLKRRFGEFTAFPTSEGRLDIDDEWIDANIMSREIERVGTVSCHKKVLALLRKAMAEVPIEASLGDIGDCFDESWTPDMPQGILPAALWGASIHVNVSLNRPGFPPFLDDRIVETMTAWGFRWAGEDAYPDGSLFESLAAPPREGSVSPSPTD